MNNIEYHHSICRLYLSLIACVLPVSVHNFDCWHWNGNNMKKILVLVSTSELGNFLKMWREVVIWFYWCDDNLFFFFFGFTESLEPKPECDPSQHEYEEIVYNVGQFNTCQFEL
jgi:hypothetical protein